eukprot:11172884-Lingulodinium_polyedra.AAC.1
MSKHEYTARHNVANVVVIFTLEITVTKTKQSHWLANVAVSETLQVSLCPTRYHVESFDVKV